jgi:uncharacterized lipoprotein YmbA
VKSPLMAGCLLSVLCACAASRPDRFYVLSVQPPGSLDARTMPATEVSLKVVLPSMVDRGEMIIQTSADGVRVLEHERWAAPITDMVTQTLARDLERRRADLLVSGAGASRAPGPPVKISVEVLQLTVRQGDAASIEAHWRILDPHSGKDTVGGEVFNAPMTQDGYAAIAQGLSACLSQLADRLIAQL